MLDQEVDKLFFERNAPVVRFLTADVFQDSGFIGFAYAECAVTIRLGFLNSVVYSSVGPKFAQSRAFATNLTKAT